MRASTQYQVVLGCRALCIRQVGRPYAPVPTFSGTSYAPSLEILVTSGSRRSNAKSAPRPLHLIKPLSTLDLIKFCIFTALNELILAYLAL